MRSRRRNPTVRDPYPAARAFALQEQDQLAEDFEAEDARRMAAEDAENRELQLTAEETCLFGGPHVYARNKQDWKRRCVNCCYQQPEKS